MTTCAPGVRQPSSQKPRKDGARVNALKKIKEEGWGVGTWLIAPKWKAARRIEMIEGPEVRLRSPAGCGYSDVRSLPAKVKEAPAESVAP